MARDVKSISMDDLSKQSKDFYEAINEGTDLACVLISTSYLDQCLASLLEKHFTVSDTAQRLLDYRNGAIGSLSTRNDVSYCLGLISKKLYQNIKTAGEIRNVFAHSHISISFTDINISKLVEKLTFPQILAATRIENGESQQVADSFSNFTEPRIRFSIITTLTVNEVIAAAMSTDHRPKK